MRYATIVRQWKKTLFRSESTHRTHTRSIHTPSQRPRTHQTARPPQYTRRHTHPRMQMPRTSNQAHPRTPDQKMPSQHAPAHRTHLPQPRRAVPAAAERALAPKGVHAEHLGLTRARGVSDRHGGITAPSQLTGAHTPNGRNRHWNTGASSNSTHTEIQQQKNEDNATNVNRNKQASTHE